MTEADWQRCTNPKPMLAFVRRIASDAELRLFACGCCRRLTSSLVSDSLKRIAVAERFANGLATRCELAAVRKASLREASYMSWKTSDREFRGDIYAARAIAAAADLPWPRWMSFIRHYSEVASLAAAEAASSGWGFGDDRAAEFAAQADLLRSIVNPYISTMQHPTISHDGG